MPADEKTASQIIRAAYSALRQKNRTAARRLAQQALTLDPKSEEAWLILAAVASPRGSLAYLNKALEINPGSKRAQDGLRWAQARITPSISLMAVTQPTPAASQPRQAVPPVHTRRTTKTRPVVSPWLAFLAFVSLCMVAVWYAIPLLSQVRSLDLPQHLVIAGLIQATNTQAPSPTLTETSVPTSTITATAIPSETPTTTPVPTNTATPVPPTNTPLPTETSTPVPTLAPTETATLAPSETPTDKPRRAKKKKKNAQIVAYEYPGRPKGVGDGEAWIDVDLSSQTAYAYEGDNLVRSFVVSTGTWLHPTVTGTFQIYVKYRAADMYGTDYYLPNVPYVMYFYEGYGLHGTYWHNNFGTPMSHGCVNFTPEDAGWLFEFARVGTTVHVHN